jgi:hypothetical protein
MASVLLISELRLKSWTNINKNVDMDAIRAEIGVAQDLHLMPLLGAKFYYHLLSQVSSTGNTFNADELTLVNDYISPFLVNKSYAEMLPHLHFRTMNRAVVEGNMESANAVSIETMKYLRGLQQQRADFYMQRMLDYLNTGYGQNKYPDYVNYTSMDGITPNKVQKYNPGIVLRQTTRKGYKYNERGINSWSEREHENPPPCAGYDCY